MNFFRTISVIALLCCYGCTTNVGNHTTPVHDHHPKIDVPEKPQLEALTKEEVEEYKKISLPLREKLQNNDTKVKLWTEQMAVAIEIYNRFADGMNTATDLWVKQTLGGEKK